MLKPIILIITNGCEGFITDRQYAKFEYGKVR
jgi:hypothetical protein